MAIRQSTMQSRGLGATGVWVNYGATDEVRQPLRTNPFDEEDGDDYASSKPISRGNAEDSCADMRDSISGDFITIGSSASSLERSLKLIGTVQDTPQFRDKIHESEMTTNKVINRAATSLRRLSSLCAKGDRVERLQCERLTGEFKDIVQRYSSIQKKVAEKVKATPTAQPSRPAVSEDLIGWNDGGEDGGRSQQQQQLMLQEQADTEVMLLLEREQQIKQLEGDILDINQIFRDLGTLVHEQGQVIDSIEANVESAHSDVEAGREQLQQAAIYQNKARKKKCCLITILIVVVAIIILIIVLSVKLHK